MTNRRAGVGLAGIAVLATMLLGARATPQEPPQPPPPPAPPPQKIRLREGFAKGDVSTVTTRMEMSARLTYTAKGLPPEKADSTALHEETYRSEVLAVDAKGPAVERRRYTKATIDERAGTGASDVRKLSYAGQTVTLTRRGGKATLTSSGKLRQDDRAELIKGFQSPEPRILPARPVAPGESWTVDPKALAPSFPGATVSVRCRFQDIAQFEGYRCAVIRVTMRLTEPAPKDFASTGTISATLTGDMFLALALNRVLYMDLTGPTRVTGTQKVDGTVLAISGQGTAQVTFAANWHRVAGKAVQPPEPAPDDDEVPAIVTPAK